MFNCATIRRFSSAQSGNVAMMTGLAMMTIMMGVGAAADYSVVSERRNSLQNMADAAVLAAARSGEDNLAKLTEIAETVVHANNARGWPVQIDVRLEDGNVVVDVASNYNPIVMGIVGRKNVPVSVTTASPIAKDTPIELALVLDTTDSMKDDNMDAMRLAANAMLTDLEKLDAPIRVSIVPFGQYVNIGTSQGKPGSRSWIDMRNYGTQYKRCKTPNIQVVAPTCVVTGTETYTVWRDGRNMGTRTRKTRKCTGGKWKKGEKTCQMKTRDWHGCMGTRTNDAKAAEAQVNGAKLPAAIDQNCGSELMPLSTNFNKMRTKVTSLKTKGSTYLPGGLAWGWRTLDPSQPYTEAKSTAAKEPTRAMLFMTDGLNNLSRGDGKNKATGVKHRYTKDKGAGGLKLTKALCDAINADEIDLFVVAYQVPGKSDTAKILSECATSEAHFFEPSNSDELIADFRQIGSMLDYTRLAY